MAMTLCSLTHDPTLEAEMERPGGWSALCASALQDDAINAALLLYTTVRQRHADLPEVSGFILA